MWREKNRVFHDFVALFGGGVTSCVVSGGVWTLEGVVCSVCLTYSEGRAITWSIVLRKGTGESLKRGCVVRSEEDSPSWRSRCAYVIVKKLKGL